MPTPDVAAPEPSRGDLINDRYRVIQTLGRGGMGEVLLVEDLLRDGQRLALKTLLPESTERLVTSGFRNEFSELAKIRHPNLAAAYDFGRVTGTNQHFFTTEYIDGVDLLAGTKDATIEQLIQVAAQLLRGLDFIHSHGLLHNDLKPANILLENRTGEGPAENEAGDLTRLEALLYGDCGRVRIIDFGLICREHTATHKILGTVRYISPERIRRVKADRRSDLYSLGVVLYVLFARRVPFDHTDVRALLKLHLEAPPPPLDGVRRDLPEIVPRLVHRLLEKRPEDRFPSGAQALEYLARALGWHGAPGRSGWQGGSQIAPGALLFREEELAVLKASYDGARGGELKSHCVVVQGAAGSGKSRLVEELRSYVQVSGGVFAQVSGPEVEGNLQPVLEALIAGMQTSGLAKLGRIRELVARSLESHSENLATLLEKLVLASARSLPLLLHFDDFDRASDVVRRFALELVHTADYRSRKDAGKSKLLVVISRRTTAGSRDVPVPGARVLAVENFAQDTAREFILKVFRQDDVPHALLDELVRTSGGNPLFLLELANTLVERKEVVYSGARWRFPESLSGIALPESLGGLFEEKVANLDSNSLEVLYWLAAAGHALPHRVLLRCLRFDAAGAGAVIEDLVRKSLVCSTTRDGSVEYLLSHAGSRETLSSRLSDERMRQLRQRIAQSLEDELPDSSESADLLAEHWLQSGNDAGFLRFAPQAAELLQKRGDFHKAVEYHRRIAEAMPDTAVARKVGSLSKLAEMHEFLWDLSSCQKDLLEIERLGSRLLARQDLALLYRRMACVEIARHDFEKAEEFLSKAYDAAGGEDAPALIRHALDAARCWPLWSSGRHEDARATLERSRLELDRSEPATPRERLLVAGAATHLANLEQQIGELRRAAERYDRNLEQLRELDQPQALCATHCALGGVLLQMGRLEKAQEHLEASLELSKEIGDLRTLSRAREKHGEYHLRMGQVRNALHLVQAGLRQAEDLGNREAMASSLRILGRIYYQADQLDDAAKVLGRAIELRRGSKDTFESVLCGLDLVRLHLERGSFDAAREALAACARDAARVRAPLLESHCEHWAFVLDWRERRSYDEDRIERGIGTLEAHEYALDRNDLLLSRLEVAIGAGRQSESEAILARLERLLSESPRSRQCAELEYLKGLFLTSRNDFQEASAVLRAVARRSRDQGNLRLAHKARRLLQKVPAAEAVRSGDRRSKRPALPR